MKWKRKKEPEKAAAEESAAASRELSDQAQMMKNLIVQFQIK